VGFLAPDENIKMRLSYVQYNPGLTPEEMFNVMNIGIPFSEGRMRCSGDVLENGC
jgi:hypothetical protein